MALDTITIQTTQNVSIDYDLANVGARIGAFLIDSLILFVFFAVLVFLVANLEIDFDETVFIAVGPFAYIIFYFFLFETFNQGQTIGKAIVGLKVIRMDGRDPTPGDFLARAIFLMVDVLLSAGMAATLLVGTGKNKQRLGDMTAGTVVIQANTNSVFSLEEIKGIKNRDQYEPVFPNVQRFTDDDMMIVKQSLHRMRKYQNPAHRQAVRQLSIHIAKQLGLEPSEVPYTPEKFLETILMDYIVITR